MNTKLLGLNELMLTSRLSSDNLYGDPCFLLEACIHETTATTCRETGHENIKQKSGIRYHNNNILRLVQRTDAPKCKKKC